MNEKAVPRPAQEADEDRRADPTGSPTRTPADSPAGTPAALTVADFTANLATIRARIAAACARVGRDPNEVELLPVSKTVPAERLRLAYQAGMRKLGEAIFAWIDAEVDRSCGRTLSDCDQAGVISVDDQGDVGGEAGEHRRPH